MQFADSLEALFHHAETSLSLLQLPRALLAVAGPITDHLERFDRLGAQPVIQIKAQALVQDWRGMLSARRSWEPPA